MSLGRMLASKYSLAILAQLILISPTFGGTVTYHPSLDKLVVTKSRVDTITNGHKKLDAPISTYTSGGKRYWIMAFWQRLSQPEEDFDMRTWHTITEGPIGDIAKNFDDDEFPVKQNVILPPHPNGTPSNQGGLHWITNTYQDSTGVLAFVHSEHATNLSLTPPLNGPGQSRIGLAWASGDPGAEPVFQHLGHVISGNNDPSSHNVHGTPYLIHNDNGTDYIYVYFHEASSLNNGFGHIGVARSSLANVLFKARQGKLTNWHKYNGSTWVNASGMGGYAAPLNIWPAVVHSDAAKSTYNGRYYLAVYIQRDWKAVSGNPPNNPGEFVIYESCDALQWTESLRFNQNSTDDIDYRYISITDELGADNGIIGDRMRLYAIKKDVTSGVKESEVYRYTLSVSNTPCP